MVAEISDARGGHKHGVPSMAVAPHAVLALAAGRATLAEAIAQAAALHTVAAAVDGAATGSLSKDAEHDGAYWPGLPFQGSR